MKDYVGRNAIEFLVRDRLRRGYKISQTEEGYHVCESRNNGNVKRERIMSNGDGIPDWFELPLGEEISPAVRRKLPD